MKESDFISQNRQKWTDFEKELSASDIRPDKVSYYYIDTIDDLSYARTHYPNRLVRQYLNGISQILSLKIYKSQRVYWKNIVRFWKKELPMIMYESRREFLLSFIIFALSFGIGILSVIYDDSFPQYILSENYVNQTLENIEKGDPMAVYKDPEQAKMFLNITYNNIFVCVKTYLLSLFFGFGTISIMIYNGIMIGAFQYYFVEHGLFFDSFLTVWQHGTIEVSCIILAGTAGLVLARGVLFPGTYSRLDAFRLAGRKSLIIMLGLMPLLVYSGAVEGFVTRYTDMHWFIRLCTILLSFTFVLVYFIWYPRKLAGSAEEKQGIEIDLQPIRTTAFSFTAIEKTPVIMWKALQILGHHRKKWFLLTLSIATLITTAMYLFTDLLALKSMETSNAYFWAFFDTQGDLKLFVYNALMVFAAGAWGIIMNYRTAEVQFHKPMPKKKLYRRSMFCCLFLSLLMASALTNGWMSFGLFIVLPFMLLLINHYIIKNTFLKDSIPDAFDMMGKALPRMMSLMFVHVFIWLLLSFFVQTIINSMLPTFLGYILVSNTWVSVVFFIVSSFIIISLLFAFYTLMFLSLSLSYFSIREMSEAAALSMRIKEMFPITEADSENHVTILNAGKFE